MHDLKAAQTEAGQGGSGTRGRRHRLAPRRRSTRFARTAGRTRKVIGTEDFLGVSYLDGRRRRGAGGGSSRHPGGRSDRRVRDGLARLTDACS